MTASVLQGHKLYELYEYKYVNIFKIYAVCVYKINILSRYMVAVRKAHDEGVNEQESLITSTH